MILLRRVIGDALRARRQSQHRTLREVSTAANVSLGYLSEIERGQKEASSELLAAICDALGAQLSELLREVSHTVAAAELGNLVPAGAGRSPLAPRPAEPLPVASSPTTAATTVPAVVPSRSTVTPVPLPAEPAVARASATRPAATRPITPGEGADFRAGAAGIVLPHAHRSVTVDGDVAVAVVRNGPLKATLRATRGGRSPKRGREVALSR